MGTFKSALDLLKTVYHQFDEQGNARKLSLLREISGMKLPLNRALPVYYTLLLFMCAHPADNELLQLAEAELKRLSATLKNAGRITQKQFVNSGLPHTDVVSTFSQDLLKWMLNNGSYNLGIDSFASGKETLNNVLQFTLPALEKEITTYDLPAAKLLERLKIKKENRLAFLLSETDKLEQQPYIKDHFFNSLGVYVKVQPAGRQLSKAYNRIDPGTVYYQRDILKKFDALQLFNTKLPVPENLSEQALAALDTCVKNALIILQRETDPVTYIDKNSIRLYRLERGISIALYGMRPERQLPLESYVGYTLFKNGFPAAYGGGWVFGRRSLFGINIFEAMRGGESGYMMCQLLRVYRQAFGVDHFEVEPYQYGKGNPEGIQSGAFWFYYRFGFRPADRQLNALAESEAQQIAAVKGYRSSQETLRKFTQSNLVLSFKTGTPLSLTDIREKVSTMIANGYKGNRIEAEKACIKSFLKKAGSTGTLNSDQRKVLTDVALVAEAMKITAAPKLKLLKEIIFLKPVDLYAYQKALVKIFS